MNSKLNPTALEGKLTRLALLEKSHLSALLAVIKRCNFPLTTTPKNEEELVLYVNKALTLREAGKAIPFVTINKTTGEVLGTTRLANFEWWEWEREDDLQFPGFPDAVEIGWTWLSPEAHGTGINAEAKLLQLRYAFEDLKVKRVNLKTDERNTVSKSAILKLGASLDGVLRLHSPAADNGIRNTAMYSILHTEWPGVRERLNARLQKHL